MIERHTMPGTFNNDRFANNSSPPLFDGDD